MAALRQCATLALLRRLVSARGHLSLLRVRRPPLSLPHTTPRSPPPPDRAGAAAWAAAAAAQQRPQAPVVHGHEPQFLHHCARSGHRRGSGGWPGAAVRACSANARGCRHHAHTQQRPSLTLACLVGQHWPPRAGVHTLHACRPPSTWASSPLRTPQLWLPGGRTSLVSVGCEGVRGSSWSCLADEALLHKDIAQGQDRVLHACTHTHKHTRRAGSSPVVGRGGGFSTFASSGLGAAPAAAPAASAGRARGEKPPGLLRRMARVRRCVVGP